MNRQIHAHSQYVIDIERISFLWPTISYILCANENGATVKQNRTVLRGSKASSKLSSDTKNTAVRPLADVFFQECSRLLQIKPTSDQTSENARVKRFWKATFLDMRLINISSFLPAGRRLFQIEIVEQNVQVHVVWNRNLINTVHVAWIGVRISRTFQSVVCNGTTF